MIKCYIGVGTSQFQFDGKEDDVAKLKQLFKVTQAVMKSRHEQVEEIMDEMEKEAKATKKKGLFSFLRFIYR